MASASSSYDDVQSQVNQEEKSQRRVASVDDSSSPRPTVFDAIPSAALYQYSFFSSDAPISAARTQYLKILLGGIFVITVIIFTIFAILWAAFYRTPAHHLTGWIVVRHCHYHGVLINFVQGFRRGFGWPGSRWWLDNAWTTFPDRLGCATGWTISWWSR